jgi:hypothetical protein
MRKLGYRNRFPSWQENVQVYAVIAVLLYGWTILWLFWELPSWLNFLTIGEILPLFAYALATNFLESILVLAGLNLFSFLLPKGWFHNLFVSGSFVLVALGLGYLMVLTSLLGKEAEYPNGLEIWSIVFLALCLPSSLLLGRIPLIRNLAEIIADRLTVFLYLIVPLSLLSLLLVVIRNLW